MKSQIAIVTGASRGIGKSIATALAKEGHKVIGTSTTKHGAAELAATMQSKGLDVVGLTLDVSDASGIEKFIKTVVEQFGAPTILVNNAGITRDNLLLRMRDDEWQSTINTNLTSVFHLCKACLRGMTKLRHGRIVNITSVVGATGNAGQANYAAAKAGVIGFTKSLAKEVGSRGITVNAVAPGFIDTDMTRELPSQLRESLLTSIPLGRFGEADEIAAAVLFLCSDSAGYITGETLHVNGGMHMA